MMSFLASDLVVMHQPALLAATTTSLAIGLFVILTHAWHGRFTSDVAGNIQSAHIHPTPRIGGLGIYFSLWVAHRFIEQPEARSMLQVILLAGIPAWLFGLLEDVTKRTGVLLRLLATICSGLIACYLTDTALVRLDVPVLDEVLRWWPAAVLFTAFAVGGIANSINIIDGYHGLSSGTSMLAFLSFGFIAHMHHDAMLACICLAALASIVGFFLLNYPWGKIFLGDGGAYFIGFVLAWVAVLLPTRNPEVSPWVSLVICAYPFIEVIYSMARRKLQKKEVGQPDNEHMHSLLARQVVRKKLRHLPHNAQNAAVAPLIWLPVALFIVPAVTFRGSTGLLILTTGVAFVLYHLLHRRLLSLSVRRSVGPDSSHPGQPQ